jgi:hypothetical protein
MKSADIKGYRDLSESDVETINEIKEAEVELGNLWKDICTTGVDMRWASIAKTHFQEGFSALVRSVAQSEDVF